jgi:hypothetical protein
MRPRRPPFAIVADGLRRVSAAPAILASTWLVTGLVAARPAAFLYRAIEQDLGASMAAASAADGVNTWWWQEFVNRHRVFADTFHPFIVGFGAVLTNVSMFLSGSFPGTGFLAPAVAYLVIWLFLIGGVLDRYARQRRIGVHGFFAAAGVFFFRFLRLAVLAAVVWTIVFGPIRQLLFDWIYPWITRDLAVERIAFAWYTTLTLIYGFVVALVMVVFDYAKVRAVVEDRRSMIGALVAGARFVRHNAPAAAGVFALNGLLFGLLLLAYAVLAPGATGGSTPRLVSAVIITQAYVLARLFVKLSFYASAVALFQDRLAHAEYTAAPRAVWPESPAIETIIEP